ncbi:MAG: aldehyde dehydrogenase family protein [Ilumatobacteraceae bacterium]
MITRDTVYIDGTWTTPHGTAALEVFDSTNAEVMARIPACDAGDVDTAVRAATAAFSAWSNLSPQQRAEWLTKIGDGLAARTDELADVMSRETGMSRILSQLIQVGLPVNSFRQAASVATSFEYERTIGNSVVVREPIGVVACITPWNYPLHQIAGKVAYALAAGCCVVLKPSEVAPLDAFILAEVVDAVGLPRGVFNLVTGTGPVVGEALAAHPLVDMVSFTGSTRAGKRVAAVAADTMKKVALELGGKSPNVICDDLDTETFAKAVSSGVGKAFLNSGQTCSALTRMLVPRSRLAEAEAIAAATAAKMTVGDPFAPDTQLGPLASAAQQDRVRGFIRAGIDEGAKLLVGGPDVPPDLTNGYYVQPTVFSEVTGDMTIAREEIFGPVLVIMPYENEEDAVRIANDTVYGLAGGVWAASPERARSIAAKIRAGQIEINGGGFNPNAPFGGYKQSGVGREMGSYGFEEFLQVKSLQT